MMEETSVSPRFAIGEVVRNLSAKYRGVVVGFDEKCQASDEWYERDPARPGREQPWYHVLVHGTTHSAYVAEEDIVPDGSGEQVVHPLVKNFFGRFQKSRYISRED